MLLREKDKQSLINIFSSIDYPFEVWAYGSRVDGSAHEGSDLDLVIRTPDLAPLPFEKYAILREKITDSTIPILVDIWDWARLPDGFHQNILEQYEVLFDNRESFSNQSKTIMPDL